MAHIYFDFDFHICGNYNLVLKHFDIANQLILFSFWHAIFSNYALYILFRIYIFTLLLVPQFQFHKLSLHIFILNNNSQKYYNGTWCSYTPLQLHVLYTFSEWGVTLSETPDSGTHTKPLTSRATFPLALTRIGSPNAVDFREKLDFVSLKSLLHTHCPKIRKNEEDDVCFPFFLFYPH